MTKTWLIAAMAAACLTGCVTSEPFDSEATCRRLGRCKTTFGGTLEEGELEECVVEVQNIYDESSASDQAKLDDAWDRCKNRSGCNFQFCMDPEMG